VTVANGVLYAASMAKLAKPEPDVRAGRGDWAILWQFGALNSVNAGPGCRDGTVYWGSGYSSPVWEGSGNHRLYAFSSMDTRSCARMGVASRQGGAHLAAEETEAAGAFTSRTDATVVPMIEPVLPSFAPGTARLSVQRRGRRLAGWRGPIGTAWLAAMPPLR